MQSAREGKVGRVYAAIAKTLVVLCWVMAGLDSLSGCNTIPRPRSSSLQDAEVNNKFITRPFIRLSQHALPHSDLRFPPESFPLFSCPDGEVFKGHHWSKMKQCDHILSRHVLLVLSTLTVLASGLLGKSVILCYSEEQGALFFLSPVQLSSSLFLFSKTNSTLNWPNLPLPRSFFLFLCHTLSECLCKTCIHQWPTATWTRPARSSWVCSASCGVHERHTGQFSWTLTTISVSSYFVLAT